MRTDRPSTRLPESHEGRIESALSTFFKFSFLEVNLMKGELKGGID